MDDLLNMFSQLSLESEPVENMIVQDDNEETKLLSNEEAMFIFYRFKQYCTDYEAEYNSPSNIIKLVQSFNDFSEIIVTILTNFSKCIGLMDEGKYFWQIWTMATYIIDLIESSNGCYDIHNTECFVMMFKKSVEDFLKELDGIDDIDLDVFKVLDYLHFYYEVNGTEKTHYSFSDIYLNYMNIEPSDLKTSPYIIKYGICSTQYIKIQ
jgi:hypothetical protein